MNSGESFEPDATVPVPAGGFVRRVAHTPHYDGVKKGEPAPAIIGIFGQAPIDFKPDMTRGCRPSCPVVSDRAHCFLLLHVFGFSSLRRPRKARLHSLNRGWAESLIINTQL